MPCTVISGPLNFFEEWGIFPKILPGFDVGQSDRQPLSARDATSADHHREWTTYNYRPVIRLLNRELQAIALFYLPSYIPQYPDFYCHFPGRRVNYRVYNSASC